MRRRPVKRKLQNRKDELIVLLRKLDTLAVQARQYKLCDTLFFINMARFDVRTRFCNASEQELIDVAMKVDHLISQPRPKKPRNVSKLELTLSE